MVLRFNLLADRMSFGDRVVEALTVTSGSLKLSLLSFFAKYLSIDISDSRSQCTLDPGAIYDDIVVSNYVIMFHSRTRNINIGGFLIWRFGAQSPNRQIKCIANISAFMIYLLILLPVLGSNRAGQKIDNTDTSGYVNCQRDL